MKNYLIVTANYWAFTLTDGALRMLVVLYFHTLGFGPLDIALLFIFYELFGVITNLIGGWLGARIGLNKTMNIGLALQLVALSMLLVPNTWLTIPWVMSAQALSGIAKDLNKMSAKSSIKLLVDEQAQSTLFKWVALLTGSKNALKGFGFFLGGALLSWVGFQSAIAYLAGGLSLVWVISLITLEQDLGKSKKKAKFTELFSNSRAINFLSAARLFLFSARDVWFVIAVPVYLSQTSGWAHASVGTFMAIWVVGYGAIQALAPSILRSNKQREESNISHSNKHSHYVLYWTLGLSIIPLCISTGFAIDALSDFTPPILLIGLILFGAVFAINSSVHSYLIVSYARSDGVSLDIGFYYMANALGRLLGTLLSGALFQFYGIASCLFASGVLLMLATLFTYFLRAENIIAKTIN